MYINIRKNLRFLFKEDTHISSRENGERVWDTKFTIQIFLPENSKGRKKTVSYETN